MGRHRAFTHAHCVIGQRIKGKNSVWSSGQGHFSAVKNLDPGRSSVYSAYGSDPPPPLSSFQYKYIDTCTNSRKLSVTSDAIIASRAIIIYGNVSYPRTIDRDYVYGIGNALISRNTPPNTSHNTLVCRGHEGTEY